MCCLASSSHLLTARALATVFVCLLFSGCATLAPELPAPAWWADPQQHGPQYLYFKAKGESSVSVEEARRQALNSIRGQIAEYVFSEVKVQDSGSAVRVSIESAVELREVEAFKEDEAHHGSLRVVWMLGRYPRSEYNRIRERLETGARLEQQWREAQSAVNRQQMKAAEDTLLSIVASYDKALRTSFALEAVQLELAGLYLKQERGLKARRWIVDVQKSTVDAQWRSRADELAGQLPPVSLKDAFEGRTVALYCCARREGKTAIDEGLTQELNGRLAKDALRTVAIHELVHGGDSFDDASLKRIASACAPQRADAVLVLLLDVNTAKTGAKIEIPGTSDTTDALDAKLTYFVIRVSDGLVLGSDSTVGFSNAGTGMLNTILTHRRHLPKFAPAIADGLAAE